MGHPGVPVRLLGGKLQRRQTRLLRIAHADLETVEAGLEGVQLHALFEPRNQKSSGEPPQDRLRLAVLRIVPVIAFLLPIRSSIYL